MSRILQLICVITLFFCVPIRAETEYANKCTDVIGVPVPDVDCDAPGGSSVTVGTRENGKCDRPSHGLSGCNPGTKFIKYTDTFQRNGKTETVTTMVMCRKTDDDVARGAARRGIYSDIGVIQYNETKHATCWYSSTSDGQVPTKDFEGRKVYPSPSLAQNFWGNQPQANCIECHQNGPWLRSPFASGVRPQAGKGYQRNGREGGYQAGNGNHIPENASQLSRRGLSCSVGIAAWNRATGSSGEAPLQIKINAAAYDRISPPPERRAPGAVGAGECTRCHYLGVGPFETRPDRPPENGKICDEFIPELLSGTNDLRRAGASFNNHFWMPPDAGGTNRAQYLALYGRALGAVQWCCDIRNKRNENYAAVCANDRLTSTNATQDRVLQSLAGVDGRRNPCALCPDCNAGGAGPRRDKQGGQAPAHSSQSR